jgi:hypothetical protein
MTKKNALLVYPAFATSFWSFKFALQYLELIASKR